jgi:hypothetical protein
MAAQGREKPHISAYAADMLAGLMRLSRRLLGKAFRQIHHRLAVLLRMDTAKIFN